MTRLVFLLLVLFSVQWLGARAEEEPKTLEEINIFKAGVFPETAEWRTWGHDPTIQLSPEGMMQISTDSENKPTVVGVGLFAHEGTPYLDLSGYREVNFNSYFMFKDMSWKPPGEDISPVELETEEDFDALAGRESKVDQFVKAPTDEPKEDEYDPAALKDFASKTKMAVRLEMEDAEGKKAMLFMELLKDFPHDYHFPLTDFMDIDMTRIKGMFMLTAFELVNLGEGVGRSVVVIDNIRFTAEEPKKTGQNVKVKMPPKVDFEPKADL